MEEAGPSRRAGRIIAVGGGKGGAGKTVFSTNLALALAERGHRVLIVDADLGGANVHTVLGVPPPSVTLSDFLTQGKRLDDVAVQTPFSNLMLLSGALDDIDAANPSYHQKMRLLRHLHTFDTDFMVLDLGAGTAFNIVDFFLIADMRILVVRPEPTSVENAYRFLKAGYLRRLKNVGRAYGISEIVEAASRPRGAERLSTPADVIRAIYARDVEVGREVEARMQSFAPHLVVNDVVEGTDDVYLAEDMASGCRRFFGIPLEVLGTVPGDANVPRSVRSRQPLLRVAPTSGASRAIRAIAGLVEEKCRATRKAA